MTVATTAAFRVDWYVVDVLLCDLVGHDRSPAAFLVYLLLWRRTRGASLSSAKLSHRDIAEETGLSKSAVQQALRILHRRGLVKSKQQHRTDTPEHSVHRPWVSAGRKLSASAVTMK
jgi:transcription initiation factor IIE alpha subunit